MLFILLNFSSRCGPPLMIAQSAALPQTLKINLSVSITCSAVSPIAANVSFFCQSGASTCTDTVVSTFDCSISLLPAFLLHSVSALFWRQACRRSFHSFSTDCNIAISTYSMVSFTGKRSWEAGEVRENNRHPSLHACFIPLVLFSARFMLRPRDARASIRKISLLMT